MSLVMYFQLLKEDESKIDMSNIFTEHLCKELIQLECFLETSQT